MTQFFPTVTVQSLEDGRMIKCQADGVAVLLARDSEGKIFAFENNCSHADKPLERGLWKPESREIVCPFHKAVFDVSQNGAVKSGPAVVSLTVFTVEVRVHEGVETIFVGLDTAD
jgi:nitrite reductase/ring-hydroxylating ferredoxin subunit